MRLKKCTMLSLLFTHSIELDVKWFLWMEVSSVNVCSIKRDCQNLAIFECKTSLQFSQYTLCTSPRAKLMVFAVLFPQISSNPSKKRRITMLIARITMTN